METSIKRRSEKSPPRKLELTEAMRVTLEEMRDHHAKAYLRERAAALLKIAAGQSVAEVARSGLLRRRRWETVADWLARFEAKGIGGLYMKAGRGRKPAFSPSGGQ